MSNPGTRSPRRWAAACCRRSFPIDVLPVRVVALVCCVVITISCSARTSRSPDARGVTPPVLVDGSAALPAPVREDGSVGVTQGGPTPPARDAPLSSPQHDGGGAPPVIVPPPAEDANLPARKRSD